MESPDTQTRKDYCKVYHSKEREARIKAGRCTECGKNKPPENGKICSDCRQRQAKRRKSLPEEVKTAYRKRDAQWRADHKANIVANDKQRYNRVHDEVFTHYGGKCACCGETNPAFLTIDHVNGNGNKHRRQLFGVNVSGRRFWAKLRELGYPEGFQVLCWNCNMAKAFYGTCPHQKQPSMRT